MAEFKINHEYTDSIIELWINKNDGTIIKIINTNIDSDNNETLYVNEYKITYNVVTDDDVERPDLSDYSEENNIENSYTSNIFDTNANKHEAKNEIDIKLNDYNVKLNENIIILENNIVYNN